MRAALRRAWWNLAVASGVSMASLASLAAAQTPQWLPVGPKTAELASVTPTKPPTLASTPTSQAVLPTVPAARRETLGEPYVTTCLVSVVEAESDESPAPPPSAVTLSAAVKSVIERACGLRASNVQVAFDGHDQATVHLAAPNEADANRFWNIIQALPELMPYSLNAEVHLPK